MSEPNRSDQPFVEYTKPEIVWWKPDMVPNYRKTSDTDIPCIPLDALEAWADRLRVKQGACRLNMEDERYNEGIDDLLAWFQQAAERQESE